MAAVANSSMDVLLNALSQLTLKVDNLTALAVSQSEKIASLQAAQSAPRTSRKSATVTSTPAGVDATTGQPVEKFPSNTILWLKKKAAENPKFLPSILSQPNYDAIEKKHAKELEGLTEVERAKKMAQKVWTELGELAEKASHVETRDHSAKLIKFFKDTWTAEKNAYKAANPTVAAPPTAPGVATQQGGVLVPDTPVFVQPLVATPSITLQPFAVPEVQAAPVAYPQPPVLQPVTLSMLSPVTLNA
jgi:hypothetical protein